MQIRIKLTFIGLPLRNKHCNKNCLALTKTTKRQRIEEFSLFVFQPFSLNGIYNIFRREINDKVTTILPIVAMCSSYNTDLKIRRRQVSMTAGGSKKSCQITSGQPS